MNTAGIPTAGNEEHDRPRSHNDVIRWKTLLLSKCGYKPDDIIILWDHENATESELPTDENIVE